MTLALDSGIQVKSWPPIFSHKEERVFINGVEMTTLEFLQAALYVLTNTDLIGEDDPKKQFVDLVKKMNVSEGLNHGFKMLKLEDGSFSFAVAFSLEKK